MAEQCPNKNDIQLVFKRLRSIPTNKSCFDCNAKNPTWASVTYGVFICIDCSAVHRSLGVHVTFVRSTQLDTNWTWLQLRQMQLGGNVNATTFFRQHNCTTTDAQQKYNSRAAQLYREKIHQLAIQAMRLHGTKLDLGSRLETALPKRLHLESHSESTSASENEKKEEDFFEELSNVPSPTTEDFNDDITSVSTFKVQSNGSAILAGRGEPNVDAALSGHVEPTPERKPTIGVRKPQSKRPGLAGKKGGLGAQKVKANFADIEREAALADQMRIQAAEEAKLASQHSAEEEQKQMASMRLAYQDLSLQQRKQEEQLRRTDPVKAQQVERLGMGVSARSGVSHSALSDMKVIEQESPSKISGGGKSLFDRDNDSLFSDDYHFMSPGYSMYKSPSENKVDSLFLDTSSGRDRYSSNKGWSSGEPERTQPLPGASLEERSPPPREPIPAPDNNGQAQKKFGSAKAISSDQYFGDSADNTWERRANLSRFEGSSSISSADYFGTGSSANRGVGGGGAGIHTPDLEEVKESVRQGVTKVAGKLSSIASGVMSSIQDRYGY